MQGPGGALQSREPARVSGSGGLIPPTFLELAAEVQKLNKNKKVRALVSFLVFASVMVVSLIAIRAVLTKMPVTAALFRQAQTGTLTVSILFALDGTGLLALLIFTKLASIFERKPFGAYGLPLREAFQKTFWCGLAWGFCLASLDIGITYALGGFTFDRVALSGVHILSYGLAWAGAFVIVGLFEEFLYRGYTQHTLGIALGFWPAAILLSALFAALHLTNAGESLTGALDVFIYSLLACFTLHKTGSLWFAVGLHAAWDFSLTFLFSVPGSGMHAKGQLLASVLHGPQWLTGGMAGPEGSTIGLALLLISFPIFARLSPERKVQC